MSIRRFLQLGILLLSLAVSSAQTGCTNANMISPEQEIRLGEDLAPKFLAQGGGRLPHAGIQEYVRTVGSKILAQVKPQHDRGMPWEFHVLNSPVLNAFALPGGKVFVSRGLLEKLHNEAELAAVLGHEIGHVTAQHIGKQMTRQMLLQTGLSVATGATDNQWVSVLGDFGAGVAMLGFSRDQELEADRVGLTYLTRAGYDSQGLIGVLEVLAQEAKGEGSAEFFSTHPQPATRLEQAQVLIQKRSESKPGSNEGRLDGTTYGEKVLEPLKSIPPSQKKSKK